MSIKEKYQIPTNSVICIAGTVGVGKSTMTQSLANALNFKTSFEIVDENPYLDQFYADFSRWSFHLQIYFLAERFKEQKLIYESGGGYVQDRSIYEDTDIFAKMHYDNGTMSKVDYNTYKDLFDAMVMTPYFPHPDLLIYIEGSLEKVIERIHKRGREMEKNTSISYWEELHKRYETWINEFTACPVLKINMEQYDLINKENSIHPILEEIGQMLQRKK